MKEISTVCARDCYDACGLIVRGEDSGRILSVRGDPSHPFTRGFACPRGARDPVRLLRNRVEGPCLREGGGFRKTDWKEALGILSKRLGETLKKEGPERVLFLNYAGNAGLLTEVYPQRIWRAVGATLTDYALCSRSGHRALRLHYGASYGINPEDLPSMDLIVFWGFNAAVSSPHTWRLAGEARRLRGAVIVVVDPVRGRSADGADLWIRPRPGTDVALAYGVMNLLIQRDYIDREFIGAWTDGFGPLREEASGWPPERVERVTGVSRKALEALGEAYGRAGTSATLIGIGLQKCDRGADQVRAVSFIPALMGLHRGFFYSNSDAYSIREAEISGEALSSRSSGIVGQVAVPDLVREGAFSFIHVSGMNPALTLPNQNAFREGISREGVFLVVHETHWTKTAMLADLVLPAPTYLEKEDLIIAWSHNLIKCSPRAVSPVTDSRSEIQVMEGIARGIGLRESWLYEDPWRVLEAALEGALEEGSFGSLRSGERLRLRRRPLNRYWTPSGRILFHTPEAGEEGLDPLPKQGPSPGGEGGFVLVTSATPRYTHTQFQEVYGPIPPEVSMNPGDAERLRVEKGDLVALFNDRGRVTLRVAVSDRVQRGVLWAPRQSEDPAGEALNSLTSSIPQEMGGGPRFNSTRVFISRVPK